MTYSRSCEVNYRWRNKMLWDFPHSLKIPSPKFLQSYLEHEREEMKRGRELEQGERQAPNELPPAKVAQYIGNSICVLDLLIILLLLHFCGDFDHCGILVITVGCLLGRLLLLILVLVSSLISPPPFICIINTILERRRHIINHCLEVRVEITRAKGKKAPYFARLLLH